MPGRRYEVRVTGQLSERVRNAFAGMDFADVHVETVIAGQRSDDEHLHDILSVIQSLGLRVVSVEHVGS